MRVLHASDDDQDACRRNRRSSKDKPPGKQKIARSGYKIFSGTQGLFIKCRAETLLEIIWRPGVPQQAQGGVNLFIGIVARHTHRPLLCLSSSAANSRRARKMRERIDDSVVAQILAISAVDSSSSAESSSASRSFFGN